MEFKMDIYKSYKWVLGALWKGYYSWSLPLWCSPTQSAADNLRASFKGGDPRGAKRTHDEAEEEDEDKDDTVRCVSSLTWPSPPPPPTHTHTHTNS